METLLQELEASLANAESRKVDLAKASDLFNLAKANSEQSIQQVREVRDKLSRYIDSLGGKPHNI